VSTPTTAWPALRVATWNIHKGVQGHGPAKRLEIHNIGHGIEQFDADLICLQEVLEAVIDHPSGPIKLVNLHLAHVGVEERLDQIAFLQRMLANPMAEGGPWSGTDDEPSRNWTEGEAEPPNPTRAIWAGDFNMEPGSAEYRALLGETPYHPGARYAHGLTDPAARIGLHTHVKVIAGQTRLRQLDHVFLTPDLAPLVTQVRAQNDCPASDHHPLHVDLAL